MIGQVGKNSKTTFVTVNHIVYIACNISSYYSKTTFVTVNRKYVIANIELNQLFKNNVCYC